MRKTVGSYLPISQSRRFIADLMHASRNAVMIPMERRQRLRPLVRARNACSSPVSWCAIFTKAYALACARRRELRRAYVSYPWPRLYEHPCNVATIAVERRIDDEDGVFFVPIKSPEKRSVCVLDAHLRSCKEQPIEKVPAFQEILKLSRRTLAARRLHWWWQTEVSGPRRAAFLGTFGVSVTAGLGAGQLGLRSPLTSSLHYGPFDPDGSIDVRVTFDHRVVDGGTVARALAELEEILLTTMVDELGALSGALSGVRAAA
jgi:hypothetical protein